MVRTTELLVSSRLHKWDTIVQLTTLTDIVKKDSCSTEFYLLHTPLYDTPNVIIVGI